MADSRDQVLLPEMAKPLSSCLAASFGSMMRLPSGDEQIVDLSLCLFDSELPLLGSDRDPFGGNDYWRPNHSPRRTK